MKSDFFIRLILLSVGIVGLSVSLGVAIQREFKYGRIFFEETCSSDTLQPGCGQDISAVSGSEDVFPVVHSEELPHR